MKQIWLTSDEHYGHEKIIGYCNRAFKDTKEMQYEIITRHNEVVGKEDTVYHLGDVFWGDNWKALSAILKRLNGQHHLIIGNHDHMPIWNYVEAGFISVHTSLALGNFTMVHDPAVAGVLTDRNFIHGHTHNLGLQLGENTYSVCVEMHNYYPVRFGQILDAFPSPFSNDQGH